MFFSDMGEIVRNFDYEDNSKSIDPRGYKLSYYQGFDFICSNHLREADGRNHFPRVHGLPADVLAQPSRIHLRDHAGDSH